MTDVDALIRIQEGSFARADRALRASFSPERAMGAAELASFLDERTYCVLATTTGKGRPQARPVGFTFFEGAFWFATVAGGRLRNVERTPWVSVVIAEDEHAEHRTVIVDGPVTIHEGPPAGLLDLWEQRIGSRAEWAAAWLQLEPERIFSYTRA